MIVARFFACCLVAALFALTDARTKVAVAESNAGGVSAPCCQIVELRQYTLVPGKRDELIRLFEDHFIESQEAAGITAIAQFRVLDDPNTFYWLRGFDSVEGRATALSTFYHGPVWPKYRGIANSLLLETENVLLLHPAHDGSGFAAPSEARPPIGSTVEPRGLVVATIYDLGPNTGVQFDQIFEKTIRPVVQNDGAKVLGTFVTDHRPNSYPSLQVRSDANVFVWLACYPSEAAYEQFAAALATDPQWWQIHGGFALAHMYVPPEVDRLSPTPRSALRCEP
jgi:NIPSNAP